MTVRTRLQKRLQEQSDTHVKLLLSATFFLVNSGFVSARELGLVAPVCRATNGFIREQNELWVTLCHRYFPSAETGFDSSFVEKKGHEWLYKRLAVPIDRLSSRPVLAPPSCTCEELQLVVQIQCAGTQIFYHHVGEPHIMTSLLENGSFGIVFNPLIDLGKAVWTFSDMDRELYERGEKVDGLPFTCDRNDFDVNKLSVNITLVRRVGSEIAIFSLYDSKRPQVISCRDGTAHPVVANGSVIDQSSPFDLGKKRIEGRVVVHESRHDIQNWPLKQSRQAHAIMSKLSFEVRVGTMLTFDVVEGDRFVLQTCYVLALKYLRNGEFDLFQSRKKEENNGVTLLHILSELHEG